jgi:hypothetical protein
MVYQTSKRLVKRQNASILRFLQGKPNISGNGQLQKQSPTKAEIWRMWGFLTLYNP